MSLRPAKVASDSEVLYKKWFKNNLKFLQKKFKIILVV